MGNAVAAHVETEEAIFRSGHEALRFAFAYSTQQYPVTIMARLMKGAGLGSGRGLFGLDGAAVAGTVKRHVEGMPAPASDVLGARYSVEVGQQLEHAARLVPAVMPALGTGVHHTRMVLALILRHFGVPGWDGQPVKLAALCDQFAMDAATMTRRWQRVRRRLTELESSAQVEADTVLVAAGLVG